MRLYKRFIGYFGLGMLVAGQFGCATLSERVSEKIQYSMPKKAVSPGDVLNLGFIFPEEVKGGVIRFLNRNYQIFRRNDLEGRGVFMSFLPIPNVEPGEYPIECKFSLKEKGDKKSVPLLETLNLQVLPVFGTKPVESVKSKKFKAQAYILELSRVQQLIQATSYKAKVFQPFLQPVGGEMVSNYGKIRKYGIEAEVTLEGIEIIPNSASMVEVNTPADGEVIMAEKLPMLGNTVLIDHGFSFTTLHCHLKNLQVKPGQRVARGDNLGQVGRTGEAAVGKRLYYQIYVAGTPIDVERFSKMDIFK